MNRGFLGRFMVLGCALFACDGCSKREARQAEAESSPSTQQRSLPPSSDSVVSNSASAVVPANEAVVGAATEAKGLRITLRLTPEVRVDRIPLRVFALEFENVSAEPIRIYMPSSEPFRAGISSIFIVGSGATLSVPEPRPHGYVVTERDFPLLEPGRHLTFEQTFTLDPMTSGSTQTQRLAGFAPGTQAAIHWTYANTITVWRGNQQTLDGPTQVLFGGGAIPHIWTGQIDVSTQWTIP